MLKIESGYSLPELLIILTLLAIIIGSSLPYLSNEKRQLKLEAQKVIAFLKTAQNLAFYKNEKVKVKISPKEISLLKPTLVKQKSAQKISLSTGIEITNVSHTQISFTPQGTGTACSIKVASQNYSCQITNSIFNRLKFVC